MALHYKVTVDKKELKKTQKNGSLSNFKKKFKQIENYEKKKNTFPMLVGCNEPIMK